MRCYVINLDTQPERLQRCLLRCASVGLHPKRFRAITPDQVPALVPDPCPLFSDLTPGLQACSLSHLLLWKHCLDEHPDEDVLILEDDVVFHTDFMKHLKGRLADPRPFDALQLNVAEAPADGWNRVRTQELVACSYYKPSALKWLVGNFCDTPLLSDFMAAFLQDQKWVETHHPLLAVQEFYESTTRSVAQVSLNRSALMAMIDADDYLWDVRLHLMTLCSADRLDKMKPWEDTAKHFGWTPEPVVVATWGGLQDKIHRMAEAYALLPPDDIVVFTDATDVLINGTPMDALKTFHTLYPEDRLVIGSEHNCFPQQFRRFFPNTCYCFPNSGFYMGSVRRALRWLNAYPKNAIDSICSADSSGDQAYLHTMVQEHPRWFLLDGRNTLCQHVQGVPIHLLHLASSGRFENSEMGTTSCFLHFNGMSVLPATILNLTDWAETILHKRIGWRLLGRSGLFTILPPYLTGCWQPPYLKSPQPEGLALKSPQP